jgi:hypothetical protein
MVIALAYRALMVGKWPFGIAQPRQKAARGLACSAPEFVKKVAEILQG